MGESDRAPDEWLVLRACEMFHITPDQADQLDRGRLMELMTMQAVETAIRQSETKASEMSADQLDLIGDIRRWKREMEDDD